MKKMIAYILSLVLVLGSLQIGTVETQAAPVASSKTHYGNGFEKHNADEMDMADWSNGDMFNCKWEPGNITFNDGIMTMKIDKANGGYTGGEYRTKEYFGYGMYQVCMKPIKNDGVVSSFFTYTGPADGTTWDEIDIEFLGKDTTHVQFNYYVDGVAEHEMWYDLGFDASEAFHIYGFNWYEGGITWYVDGVAVYTATGPDKKGNDKYPSHPSKIMVNVWPGIGVDDWLKPYDGKTPLYAYYDWIAYDAPTGVPDSGTGSGTGTDGSNSGTGSGDSDWTSGQDACQSPESPDWLNFNKDWWYKIISKNSGKSVDVDHGYADNGTNILQYGYKEGGSAENQQWTIEKQANGFFTIKNRKTGKVLTVEDFSTELGGNVHQWEYVGNSNQEWSIIPSGDYYKIKNRHSGYLLTVANVSKEDNANVEQYQDENGDAQLWQIECIHPQKETKDAKAATCTEDGYTGNEYCSVCNKLLGEGTVIPKTGHNWGVGMVTKVATFSEPGEMFYSCTQCGASKTESIPKLVCPHEETTIKEGSAKAATCSEEGNTGDVICSICGTLIKQGTAIAKTAHTWDEGTVTKPATTTEKGTVKFTCKECNETREVEYEADIPEVPGTTEDPEKPGNTDESKEPCLHPNLKWVNIKDATCKEQGYTGDVICANPECNKVMVSGEKTEPTSKHIWGNLRVTKQATAEEDGVITFTCTVCEQEFTMTYTAETVETPEDENDRKAAEEVMAAIYGIGAVTLNSNASIQAAKEAYEKLTDGQKELVTNYEDLENAETAYNQLKQEYDAAVEEDKKDQIKADAVTVSITSLGNAEDIILKDGDRIKAARAAYEALTNEQKTKVPQETVEALEKAEAAYKALREVYDEQQQQAADEAVAKQVIDAIAAIGKVTVNSEKAIQDAKAKYEALTPAQKELVTNYNDLVNAEAAYNTIKANDEKKQQQEEADKTEAKAVMDMIAGIGTVTLNSEKAIQDAKAAYEKLTEDQKKLVTNYDVLEAADKSYQKQKEDADKKQQDNANGGNQPAKTPAVGDTLTNPKSGEQYKVLSVSGASKTVEYKAPKNKDVKTVSIKATVKIDGVTYKVTSIANNAFKNCKKLTKATIGSNVRTIGSSAFQSCTNLKSVTIGKNVQKIGKKAFYGDKKLATITINTSKLTSKNVGANAFAKTAEKAKVKVPKKKLGEYKKWLVKKGISKKATIKK